MSEASAKMNPIEHTLPVLFAAHGAPMLLDDSGWVSELAQWATLFSRPEAILVISAHWQHAPVTIGAVQPLPLIYDFGGFPERFYKLSYPSPGAPKLRNRVASLFEGGKIPFVDDPKRGLDHGSYIPLMCMYPKADVPVLQVSLPDLDPNALLAMGRALAPLAKEGVLLFGSGFLTHNMRFGTRPGTPSWAREFDQWCAETISHHDLDSLADFQNKAPSPRLALPTWEHFAPVLVAAAAADANGQRNTSFPITGFWFDGAFTKRSVSWG